MNRSKMILISILNTVLLCGGCTAENPRLSASAMPTTTIADDTIIDGHLLVGEGAHVVGSVAVTATPFVGGNVNADGDVIAGASQSLAGDLLHEHVRTILIPGSAAVDPSYASLGGCHVRMMQPSGGTIGYILTGTNLAGASGANCPLTYPFQIQSGDWIRGWRITVNKNSPAACELRASLVRMNDVPGEEESLSNATLGGSPGETTIGVCNVYDQNCTAMTPVHAQRGWQYYLVLWPCGDTGDRALGAEVDFNHVGGVSSGPPLTR